MHCRNSERTGMKRVREYICQLRSRVRESLPQTAHVLYAKGDALYFVHLANANVNAVAGFEIEKTAFGLLLYPNAETVLDFEKRFAPVDFFTRSVERFRFQPAEAEGRKLFAQGVKLLGQTANASDGKYLQRVRNFAAVALRNGNGGGIYACARIASEITPAWEESRTR